MKVLELIELLKTKDPYLEVLTYGLRDDLIPLNTIYSFNVLKTLHPDGTCSYLDINTNYITLKPISSVNEEITEVLIF